MADFKVNKKLTDEISALRSAGKALSNEYKSVASGEVKTLQTSMDIIEQHAAIKALLDLYESLVVKDAKDMDALVKEAEKMDQSIASTHRV